MSHAKTKAARLLQVEAMLLQVMLLVSINGMMLYACHPMA